MGKMSYLLTGGRRLLRRLDAILRKAGGKYYIKTLGRLKYYLRFGRRRLDQKSVSHQSDLRCVSWNYELPMQRSARPLVSILLPDSEEYRKGTIFLRTVKNQTYSETEIIWVKESTDPVRIWNEGISKARGEYIWLPGNASYAENWLEHMVSLFRYSSVMAAVDNPAICSYVQELPFYLSGYEVSQNEIFYGLLSDIDHMLFRNIGVIPGQYTAPQRFLPLFCIQGGIVAYTDGRSMAGMTAGAANRLGDENSRQQAVECLNLLSGFPRVVIVNYALKTGGGEIFPIYLCNELKRQGVPVTLLNCNLEEREERIASLVDLAVPVVNVRHTDDIGNVLLHLGCQVVHSHHATVDYAIALWCRKYPFLGKHVITLHGMYEAIEEGDCERTIFAAWKECSRYVYIADKNLDCFKKLGFDTTERFVKLPNGMPDIPTVPILREKLGIPDDAFVLVLASRAIPEKGWAEAVKAVEFVNQERKADIHLVLLGDGPCRQLLEDKAPNYIHFMGTVSNVRDYFVMGDAGILPSRYRGESFPLSVIECLMCHRPVIASALGEVPEMLKDASGELAGILIEVEDGHIDPALLSKKILQLADNRTVYCQLQERACDAARKFAIASVAEKYIEVYTECV